MFRINVSGGELFDLIRPAALVLSALLSTWVLTSALKRFAVLPSLLWAICTFLLPLIIGPIYIAIIILRTRSDRKLRSRSRRWLLAFGYGVLLLISIGVYTIRDKRSADAHIARASQARVRNDTVGAIREYRSALKIENSPHTHKLLAIQLAEAGMTQEAIAEFRLAEAGNEPDNSINYRLGVLLEKLNLESEATDEYRKYLASESCTRKDPDDRCLLAKARLR